MRRLLVSSEYTMFNFIESEILPSDAVEERLVGRIQDI
jgi:hypothetical protein